MGTEVGGELAFYWSPSLRSPILTRVAQSKEKGSIATRGRRRSSHQPWPVEGKGRKKTDTRARARERPEKPPD